MNSHVLLVSVVVIAFVAGYSIISFTINLLKSNANKKSYYDESYRCNNGDKNKKREDGNTTNKKNKSDSFNSESEEEGYSYSNNSKYTEDGDKKYMKILGLEGSITMSDVKESYRLLLMKYHPDRVNHLGEEFQKIAEVKTREILEAYEYFKNKFNQ